MLSVCQRRRLGDFTGGVPPTLAAMPVSCMAMPDLPVLPDHLLAPDGTRLHLTHWPVAQPQPPRGLVQALHGFGEHQGRFAPLVRALNAAGWAVAGIDHRHCGRSEGARGVIRDGEDLLRDQAQLHDVLRQTYPGLPHVMVGTSLGGLLAARFAVAQAQLSACGISAEPWVRPLDAVVLIAPALAPALSPPQSATLAVLSRMVPDLPVSLPYLLAWASSDPQVVAAKQRDPLIHTAMTPRVVQHMLASARGVFEQLPAWRVPALICHATADKLVTPSAARRFVREAPAGFVDEMVCEGMAHDLLHEPCAAQVIERIVAWLGAADFSR